MKTPKTKKVIRNTAATGAKFEQLVADTLSQFGCRIHSQVNAGEKPGGGIHRLDIAVVLTTHMLAVSCKYQQVGGTAEEKLPWEIMKLATLVDRNPEVWGEYAVMILDGDGFSAGMMAVMDDEEFPYLREARKRVRIYRGLDAFCAAEMPGLLALTPKS